MNKLSSSLPKQLSSIFMAQEISHKTQRTQVCCRLHHVLFLFVRYIEIYTLDQVSILVRIKIPQLELLSLKKIISGASEHRIRINNTVW